MILATEAAYGASPGEVLLYLGYIVVYLLGPGWLIYRTLLRLRSGVAATVVMSWCLGFVFELIAFNLTAALDIRDALPLVGPAFAVLLLASDRRRELARRGIGDGIRWMRARAGPLEYVVAILFALVYAYMALGYFAAHPLPGTVRSVVYYQDIVFHTSLTAEALHHWPMEHPSIAGEPLRYHTFANMHAAAISQTTGLGVPLVVMRLFPLALLACMVAGGVALGRRLGSSWVGVGAVALLVLVGVPDLDLVDNRPFLNTFIRHLWLSPSFLVSVPFVFALGLVSIQMLERGRPSLIGGRTWALFVLLCLGLSGAKASTLPAFVLALTVFATWESIRARAAPRTALAMLGTATAVFLASYLLLYAGGAPSGFSLDPTQIVDFWHEQSDDRGVSRLALLPILLVDLLLPFAGIPLLLGLMRPVTVGVRFLLCLVIVCLGGYLLFAHPGNSQLYILWPGYLIGAALSAAGLRLAWLRLDRHVARRLVAAAAVVGIAAATAAGIAALAVLLASTDSTVEAAGTPLPFFAGLVIALGALAWLFVLRRRGGAASLGVVTLALVMSAGLFDAPGDYFVSALDEVRAERTAYPRPQHGLGGINTRHVTALEWLKDNSDPEDVIAVNNHYIAPSGLSRYFYYSALAERRAYLESWDYVTDALDPEFVGVPFPDRLRINDRAFAGDPVALEELRTAGVDYLVVDRVNGEAAEISGSAAGARVREPGNRDLPVRGRSLTRGPNGQPSGACGG